MRPPLPSTSRPSRSAPGMSALRMSALTSAILSALVGLTLSSAPALSDQLKVPPAAQRAINRPSRGMSMGNVQTTYGVPARKIAPVGQPPIERWEYPAFTVYFEYQKVIHSVAIAS